ncbi:hypothetical protein V8G54_003519 [Vigna mungo]|uniref:Uncharacterized protein n=1 Tax=Vigna mungo TaxID=3915 RepID=A0AAQ3PAL0_VIGMU
MWFNMYREVLRGQLHLRLKPLCDDIGAMHRVNLARLNGEVHLFVVIDMIEYVGDETREEVAPVLHEMVRVYMMVNVKKMVVKQKLRVVVTHEDGGLTQNLGDIEEQVREYELTTFVDEEVNDNDGNGVVNSIEGLVDINVECDLRERDCSSNMHVEVESVSHECQRSS